MKVCYSASMDIQHTSEDDLALKADLLPDDKELFVGAKGVIVKHPISADADAKMRDLLIDMERASMSAKHTRPERLMLSERFAE
jgi:hypothetical protein